MGSRETVEKVRQTATKYYSTGLCTSENELCKKGHVITECLPPDVVLEALPSKCAVNRTYFLKLQDEQEDVGAHEMDADGSGSHQGRAEVKHSHSRTWQKNVNRLETEV